MSVRVTLRICTVPFPLYCLSVWLSAYAQSHSLCIICPCDRVHLNCPISSILPVWVTALVLSRFLYTVWVIECIYIVPFPLYHLSLWPIYESTTAHLSLKKLWFMDSMFFCLPPLMQFQNGSHRCQSFYCRIILAVVVHWAVLGLVFIYCPQPPPPSSTQYLFQETCQH